MVPQSIFLVVFTYFNDKKEQFWVDMGDLCCKFSIYLIEINSDQYLG